MIEMLEKEAGEKLLFLNTCGTSLVLQITGSGYVFVPYWGGRIECTDIRYVISDITRGSYLADANGQKDFKLEQMPQIYPSHGYSDLREPAFAFAYEDGSRITDLRYRSHGIHKGKGKLSGLPSVRSADDSQVLELVLFDEVKEVEVTLTFTVYESHDAITQSVAVENKGREKMKIEKLCSASVDLLSCDFDFLHLAGAWAREFQIKRRRLEQGVQSVGSTRGAGGHGQNPFAALISPETDEEHGTVYAMNFVYSGNFQVSAEVDMHQNTRFQMGIHPFDFAWTLLPGERFQAPETVMVYSGQGLGRMSRIFHKLYRDCLIPARYARRERPVLLNSWEANYFDFHKESLVSLAEEAAWVGAELFVLDDGWFGKRNDTTSSVGDWVPNEEKLGGNLSELIREIEEKGIAFGLWFEPEMVSPDSNLYRAHPEWVMQVQGRRLEMSRDEYVLDLSNPAVCDYIIESISRILESCHIVYVKWDMNRNFTNMGSGYLSADRQKEQAHRYMLGLYRVMETLTGRFPEVLFESCAGGGGRCDPGMLYYSPQIWCSDDTDAIERLAVQEGTALLYPLSCIGAHVSACPNHVLGRVTPFETRGHVALAGTFGYELDITKLTREEKEMVKEQVKQYHQYYSLISEGEYYRLASYQENKQYDSWMVVSQDKKEALLFYVQVLASPQRKSICLRLAGLEEKAFYEVNLISGKEEIRSGAALMYAGLRIPRMTGDFRSLLCHICRK